MPALALMAGTTPTSARKKRVAVPRYLLAVSLVTLFAFLALLIEGVSVGIGGNVGLSNDLTVGALLSMAVFAIVNLAAQQSLSRSATPS